MKISGNKLFVTALKKEGVDTVFGYPGGMVVNLLDELYNAPGINMVLPRHEQGLIHAADGYARATGKVGVCLVTSGPGATNLVTGIANANYDSIPLVCFTGQVPEYLIGNDAFQEVDIVGITRNVAKFVIMVRDREMLAQRIKEAFYIARSGKPGPVLVDLPADVMAELGSTSYPTEVSIRGYKPNTSIHIGQLKKALALLKRAKKPMFLIGGGVNIAGAQAELTQLVEKLEIPVVTSVMGRGAIATDHPLYFGNIGMHGCFTANRIANECDLMVSIGCRFNDRVTGRIATFAPNAKIVHIDIESAAISRNIIVDIPIVSDAKLAITKMLELTKPMKHEKWVADIVKWQEKYPLSVECDSGVNPQKIMETLNEIYADKDTIFTSDVGQHQMWANQYLKLDDRHRLIQSGGLGTMGFGLPSAVGAQIGCREKEVVSINGDGGFQMNMQELATGVVERLPLVNVILNNTFLGMVRQMQTQFHKGRFALTNLNCYKSETGEVIDKGFEDMEYVPNFVKVADSYNSKGYRVTKDEDLKATLEEARAYALEHKRPVIVECMVSPDQLVMPWIPGGKSFDDILL